MGQRDITAGPFTCGPPGFDPKHPIWFSEPYVIFGYDPRRDPWAYSQEQAWVWTPKKTTRIFPFSPLPALPAWADLSMTDQPHPGLGKCSTKGHHQPFSGNILCHIHWLVHGVSGFYKQLGTYGESPEIWSVSYSFGFVGISQRRPELLAKTFT